MSGWVGVNGRGKGEWQGGVARREGQREEGRKGELIEGELQIDKGAYYNFSQQIISCLLPLLIVDLSNGDLQITSKMIRDESTDESRIEISFTLSQEGCSDNGARPVRMEQHVGKIIWTMSNGTAVNYTVVHNSSKRYH